MSNFDITELLTDGQTDRQMNGKVGTYVAKSGGQGDVFRARFDGCLVL